MGPHYFHPWRQTHTIQFNYCQSGNSFSSKKNKPHTSTMGRCTVPKEYIFQLLVGYTTT